MSTLQERMQRALARRRELAELAGEPLPTKAGLARACKVSTPSVAGWFNGSTASLDAANLMPAAEYLAVSPLWLVSGRGPINGPMIRVDGLQQSADQLAARSLSSQEPQAEPQPVTWDWLLAAPKEGLPWRFTVPMPDESLSGKVEAGVELVFQVGLAPRVGKPALVEHRSTGRRYVRLYAEAPAGWRAIATTDAFLSFDSSKDDVDILAAMRWRD